MSKKLLVRFSIIMFLGIKAQILFSQNLNIDTIKKTLAKSGFENITITVQNTKVLILLENRAYRWMPNCVNKLSELVKSNIADTFNVDVVFQNRKTPVLLLKNINKNVDISYISDKEKISADLNLNQGISNDNLNSSLRKIDLIFIPSYRFQLGDYSNPVRNQINITPMVQTQIFKNTLLTAQVIIPLYNELLEEASGKIRPGIISLNYRANLPFGISSSFEVGYFTRNRYGIDCDFIRPIFIPNLLLYTRITYTGQMKFTNGYIDYWPIEFLTYMSSISYYLKSYNLWTTISAGKFLYNDKGIRFDLKRQFGELTIGFFALKTSLSYNGGFNISIPIPGSKFTNTHRFRIKPADYFLFEYRATTVNSNAIMFNKAFDHKQYMESINPVYIYSQH